jgi:hypothetical protein
MRVNIISNSKKCIDLLSRFELIGDNGFQFEIEDNSEAVDRILFRRFEKNKHGWSSWIRMNFFPKGRDLKHYPAKDLADKLLKTKIYRLQPFVERHKVINYKKLQGLFFNKDKDGNYRTETFREFITKKEKLLINEYCIGLSLDFVYHGTKDGLQPKEDDVKLAYEQLKIFYLSFVKIYPSSLLYLRAHYGPVELDAKDILDKEAQYSKNDDYDSEGWVDMGRQEERIMDDETDGFWDLD